MINFLRTASILDNLGLYKLADRFTKVAIDQADLDFDEVYKNPETYSDFALTKARKQGRDVVEVLGDENFTVDPSKDPMEQLSERSKGTRRHFAIYPQILLFPESGVWKFFFMDPLSLKSLSRGSDKEGKKTMSRHYQFEKASYLQTNYLYLVWKNYMVMKKMQKKFLTMLSLQQIYH